MTLRPGDTVERGVRRGDQRQELDRIQWAGLDKVRFEVVVYCAKSKGGNIFDVTFNFEGQILKGYANVHPLRSYEAPAEVKLDSFGEATSGPYWFGRAFDAPPFFSFSAVARAESENPIQITVGVQEWHTDERNMYVGATLWFKVLCEEEVICT